MSNANNKQVGGDHYRSTTQHWDWVTNNGINYLVGCASKYICRHRKKNGIEDLEKSLHFLQKQEELDDQRGFFVRFLDRWIPATPFMSVREFAKANELQEWETLVLENIIYRHKPGFSVIWAREVLQSHIKFLRSIEGLKFPPPLSVKEAETEIYLEADLINAGLHHVLRTLAENTCYSGTIHVLPEKSAKIRALCNSSPQTALGDIGIFYWRGVRFVLNDTTTSV